MTDPNRQIHEFWNSRADLKDLAGTNDLMAKQLEMAVLAKHVRPGQKILEIGCGNGITAIELARQQDIELTGIDFSEKMILEARNIASGQKLKGRVSFQVGDIRDLSGITDRYDLVITERVLINLADWPSQAQSIRDIMGLLKPGGKYLMCENSQDGLDAINRFRQSCGLPGIDPPWHNQYLREKQVERLEIPGAKIVSMEHYSSAYYFISRVVNAFLAAQEGREPSYDAPVNRLGLLLPPMGEFGQGKLWIWEKAS